MYKSILASIKLNVANVWREEWNVIFLFMYVFLTQSLITIETRDFAGKLKILHSGKWIILFEKHLNISFALSDRGKYSTLSVFFCLYSSVLPTIFFQVIFETSENLKPVAQEKRNAPLRNEAIHVF